MEKLGPTRQSTQRNEKKTGEVCIDGASPGMRKNHVSCPVLYQGHGGVSTKKCAHLPMYSGIEAIASDLSVAHSGVWGQQK